jgi:hypothetical protein
MRAAPSPCSVCCFAEMTRALALTAVIAALVAGVSVAEAKVSGGTFRGTTSAKDPVGFSVNSSGRVQGFYFESVHVKCSDDDEFDTLGGSDRFESPSRSTYRVSKSRKFHVKVRKKNGVGWDAFGTFDRAGRRVSGRLHWFGRYNNRNYATPKGSITCESDTLRFTATRR